MLRYIVFGLLLATTANAQVPTPPTVTLTPVEVQQIMNALAPPEMKMLIGKLQQAEREAQRKEPETPKP